MANKRKSAKYTDSYIITLNYHRICMNAKFPKILLQVRVSG